jgi:glycerophosphoryl diester phosphodiesterase
MTFEQIRALDAGSWFSEKFAGTQVPTLEEVLELIPHTILCNVHLKGDPQLGADTARVITAANRLDHCFLACTLEMAVEARKVGPGIMICNMSRQGFNRKPYIDQTIESGTAFIQLLYASGTTRLAEDVARLHSNNIRVNWFGASDEALIRTLVAADVDYILTDDVDLCLSIVNENPLANESFDENVTNVTKK